MEELEKAKRKRQSRIRVTGGVLFGLLGIAGCFCLYCAVRRDVYAQALQRQGMVLMIGSGVLLLLFFAVWFIRRMDIDSFLLDEYGEECCKPFRNPEFDLNDASDAGKT